MEIELIGPLAHIKVWNEPMRRYLWNIDWSRPGAIERHNAEWELNNGHLHCWRGKFPGP